MTLVRSIRLAVDRVERVLLSVIGKLRHRDPFDRLLVAQCVPEGLTLATTDEAFRRYDVSLSNA